MTRLSYLFESLQSSSFVFRVEKTSVSYNYWWGNYSNVLCIRLLLSISSTKRQMTLKDMEKSHQTLWFNTRMSLQVTRQCVEMEKISSEIIVLFIKPLVPRRTWSLPCQSRWRNSFVPNLKIFVFSCYHRLVNHNYAVVKLLMMWSHWSLLNKLEYNLNVVAKFEW